MKNILLDRGYDKMKAIAAEWIEGSDTYDDPSSRIVFCDDDFYVQFRIKGKIASSRIYFDSQELILTMRCLQKIFDKKIGRLSY